MEVEILEKGTRGPHCDKLFQRTLKDRSVTRGWSVGRKTEIDRHAEAWLHLQGTGPRGLIGHWLVHGELCNGGRFTPSMITAKTIAMSRSYLPTHGPGKIS